MEDARRIAAGAPDPLAWFGQSAALRVIGNAVHLGRIGVVAYDRNQQLRKTREALRSRELALQEQRVEIQALRDKLQDQAVRDPLTGLRNRRHLESAATSNWRGASARTFRKLNRSTTRSESVEPPARMRRSEWDATARSPRHARRAR
jgi:hypothetical protein